MDDSISFDVKQLHDGRSLQKPHKTRYLVGDNAVWENGRLAYIGQDCQKLPAVLGRVYGEQTRKLDLSFNTIRSLEHLEMFTNLEEIILDNNCLHDNVCFNSNTRLHTLSLNKNQFTDLYRLVDQIANCYPNLTFLSLLGNPACPDQLSNTDKDEEDYQRYRYYVIFKLLKLRFLDSRTVTAYERKEATRIGPYMKVVRPQDDSSTLDEIDGPKENESTIFTPLPTTSPQEGSHRGAYGQMRYRYSGKHSEGNRFILNNDL